jgi:hypothetical protein
LFPLLTHIPLRQAHGSKSTPFAKTLIRHFLHRGLTSSQALTFAVVFLTLAMGQSAFERVLVIAVGLIALSPPVVIPTLLATANLSAVAVDADVENLPAGSVLTDTPTNNQNQGGKPFRAKAVDKGRRLWEALKPR